MSSKAAGLGWKSSSFQLPGYLISLRTRQPLIIHHSIKNFSFLKCRRCTFNYSTLKNKTGGVLSSLILKQKYSIITKSHFNACFHMQQDIPSHSVILKTFSNIWPNKYKGCYFYVLVTVKFHITMSTTKRKKLLKSHWA